MTAIGWIKSNAIYWSLAIAFLFGFGLGLGLPTRRIEVALEPQIILGWITFVGTTGIAIWSFNKTKRKESDALLFVERAKVYEKIVNVIRDILLSTKNPATPIDRTEIASRLTEARFDLIIWGGRRTIRAMMDLESLRIDPTKNVFKVSRDLYENMRRDLGHSDNAGEDIVLSQVDLNARDYVRKQIRSREVV